MGEMAVLPPGVSLASPAARFILRGGPDAVASIAAAFGVAPSLTPLTACVAGGRAALWLGPDEWLLIGEDGVDPGLSQVPHSLVDVSHRQAGLILNGPGAARMLNAGCPLDLDIAAFPAGMCARTLFHKAEIVLWRLAPERFQVEVWRSFVPYVLAHLAAGQG